MTPDDWRRAGELFHQALEIDVGLRAPWMNQVCGANSELRRELSALLESDRAARQGFVSDQVRAGIIALGEDEQQTHGERRAGPYCLVRELGRGGMGTVYLGRRDDEQYQIDVAVKLVSPGMDTELVLRRFRRERQTLADLQHPNIARLLDGGTTADGLPYIVMEYVDGLRITDYCDAQNLSVDQRLQLFLRVCSAVEHAHRNFVVHRDIKPGNILVDKAAGPKLLDFGICRLLYADPARPHETIDAGARLMTPEYASPEQIRGDPAGIASDIYSLAAVLYELLTHAKAHRLQSNALREIERVICTVDSIPPSRAVENRALARRLSGDIDNIVLRALQKEPQRRYATVEQLSEDIRRHLAHEPVRARPDTFWYRTGKRLRRNRTSIPVLALLFLSLLAGVITTSRESRRAARRFDQVRELANALIVDLSESLQNVPGATETRAKLVNTALPYLDSLAGDSGHQSGLLWELGRAYHRIGDLQGQPSRANLGNPTDALSSYRKAIRILLGIKPSSADHARAISSLVEVYQKAGLIETHLGDTVSARKDFDLALSLARQHLASAPGDENRQQLVASSCNRVGDAQLLARDPQGALKTFRAGLQAFDGREPTSQNARRTLSVVYTRIGEALLETGPIPDAVDNIRHALVIREDLFRRNPSSLEARRDLFVTYTVLGNALGGARMINIGDVSGATASYRKALEIALSLAEHDPKNQRARSDLAFGYSKLGEVTERSAPREAVEWFRRSLAITQELVAAAPNAAEARGWEAERRAGLAEALNNSGDRAAALEELRHAHRIWDELSRADGLRADLQENLLSSHCRLCEFYDGVGNREAAQNSRATALAMLGRVEHNRTSFYALRTLSSCFETFGRLEEDLARSYSASPTVARQHWILARDWYAKSVELWKEWQSRRAGDSPSVARLAAANAAFARSSARIEPSISHE